MKNSNRDKKSSGRRDFGNRDSGRGGFSGGSQMHEAICAECGKTCEVPFRPSGDKPVYCSDCFSQRQGSAPRMSGGRDFGKGRYRDRDRRMFKAICDKCHKECEVPFQPTPGKPIYCEQCFERPSKGVGAAGPRGGAGKSDQQLVSINAKLDKIINALVVAKIIKAEPKAAEKVVKEAKPAVKKEAKKKVVTKKAGKKKK